MKTILALIFLNTSFLVVMKMSDMSDRYNCEVTTAKAVNATTHWTNDECLITGPAK